MNSEICVIVASEFRPPWWLRNPHAQTILASKVARPPSIPTIQQRIELADGDFLDINHTQKPSGDVVLLLHGLAGCIDSAYISGVMLELETQGFRPVLMHWRGCSGEPNRLRQSYHSGATADIAFMLDWLGETYPNTAIHAIGYSLGANALLKYLGESQTTAVSSAIAVCPPLVLEEGAKKLDTGISRLYQRYLLQLMRGQHEKKRARYPALELPVADASLDTFWKFDDALTAPLHGFVDARDYYDQCSARQYLPAIKIPTHILCSADDPFFTDKVIPDSDELAPNTTLEVSPHGGHVGFLQGREPRRWLDQHIANRLSSLRNGC